MDPNPNTMLDKSASVSRPLGELRVQRGTRLPPTKTNGKALCTNWSIHWDPKVKDVSMRFVSVGGLIDTPKESCVSWTLLPRFRGGLAERDIEYSMFCVTVSNTHHTFWNEFGFVMILETFRASIGKPSGLFDVLLRT